MKILILLAALIAVLVILMSMSYGMGRLGFNPDVDVPVHVEKPELTVVKEPHIEQGEGTWAGIRFGGSIGLTMAVVALIIADALSICYVVKRLTRKLDEDMGCLFWSGRENRGGKTWR